jgi:hypothetical protein
VPRLPQATPAAVAEHLNLETLFAS